VHLLHEQRGCFTMGSFVARDLRLVSGPALDTPFLSLAPGMIPETQLKKCVASNDNVIEPLYDL
jgi:hypothetical protein